MYHAKEGNRYEEWWILQFGWWLSDLFLKYIQHFLPLWLCSCSSLPPQIPPTSTNVKILFRLQGQVKWHVLCETFPDPQIHEWNLIALFDTPYSDV